MSNAIRSLVAVIAWASLAGPGPLDEVEWSFMKQHTIVGDRILSAMRKQFGGHDEKSG